MGAPAVRGYPWVWGSTRLASSARQGEILVSDAAYRRAELGMNGLEQRRLELKGKSEPVLVHVLPGHPGVD